jgi:hypothetical protein
LALGCLCAVIGATPTLRAQLAPLPPRHDVHGCAVLGGVVRGKGAEVRVTVPADCGSLELVVGREARHRDTANVRFGEALRALPMRVVNRSATPVRADVMMRVDTMYSWHGSALRPVPSNAIAFFDFSVMQQPWCFAPARNLCGASASEWVPSIAPGDSSAPTRLLFIPGQMGDSFRITLRISGKSAAPDVPEPRTVAHYEGVSDASALTASPRAPARYARGLLIARFDSMPSRAELQRVADAIDGTLLGRQRHVGDRQERLYVLHVADSTTKDGAGKALGRIRDAGASGAGLVYPDVVTRAVPARLRIPHDTVPGDRSRVEMDAILHRAPTAREQVFLRRFVFAPLGLALPPIASPGILNEMGRASLHLAIPRAIGGWRTAELLEEWLMTLPYVDIVFIDITVPCPGQASRRCSTSGVRPDGGPR